MNQPRIASPASALVSAAMSALAAMLAALPSAASAAPVLAPALALASSAPPYVLASNQQGDSLSRNWAGYVATGQTYDGIHGAWMVPSVSATTSTAADATWIGIGGYESSDLVQAGTMATIQSGHTVYHAWYELLPQGMVTVPLTVSPGDQIVAAITSTDSSHWTITITDSTTRRSYATNVTYSSSQSSAEWIEERPSLSDGTLVPLDSFGTISVSDAGAIVNGADEPLVSLDATQLFMGNSSQMAVAVPSPVSGTSFSIARTSAEASDAATMTPSRRGLPQRYTNTQSARSAGWSVQQSTRQAGQGGWQVRVIRITSSQARTEWRGARVYSR